MRTVAYILPPNIYNKIGREILLGRTFFEVLPPDLAILTIITFLYFSIGTVLLKRAENNLRSMEDGKLGEVSISRKSISINCKTL